jgi:malonate-semialdehyde dehydrogenase (acetylating)/methylmalonate-semialdehyde dehydrogenase
MRTTVDQQVGEPAEAGRARGPYQVRHVIGGRWQAPAGGPTAPVYNPATGEIIAETPLGTAAEVERAVAAAARAFPD